MKEKIKEIFNIILIYFFEHPLRVLGIWFLIMITLLILSFIFKLAIPPFVSSFVGDLSAALTIAVVFNVIYPSYRKWKDKKLNK